MAIFEKKRQHPREDVFLQTKVRKPDSGIYEKGRIKDISSSGARLETEAVFEIGDRVEFIVDDDSYNEHYMALAEIKWVGRPTVHHDGDIYDGLHVKKYGLNVLKKEALPH